MNELVLQPLPDNPLLNDHAVLTRAINQDRAVINAIIKVSDSRSSQQTQVVNGNAHTLSIMGRDLKVLAGGEMVFGIIIIAVTILFTVQIHRLRKQIKKLIVMRAINQPLPAGD
jgi:hypothetical protein